MTCSARQKLDRGCDEPVEGPNVLVIDGVEHRRCPRRPILEDPEHYGALFWHYRQCSSGFLPEPGGLNDQPAKLMECFRQIDVARGKCDKFKREQEERRQRRKARGAAKGPPPRAPRRR